MDNKKLGFGLMRLPSLDPNDPAKIDIEQTKQMEMCIRDRYITKKLLKIDKEDKDEKEV